jgi:hypothetical protein
MFYDDADVIAETTAQDGTPFRVILDVDQDPINPREDYDQTGVMHIRTQSRYYVPQEFDEVGTSYLDDAIREHDFRVVARWLRVAYGATVVLPLRDRSGNGGFSVSAGSPDSAPEAGEYVGVIFDTPDTRRKTWGEGGTVEQMRNALAAEVAEYAAWAEGEVYGAIVQIAETDDEGDPIDWDEWADPSEGFMSVWGLVGREWAEQDARDRLTDAVAQYDQDAAETAARLAQEAADDAAEDTEAMRAELGFTVDVSVDVTASAAKIADVQARLTELNRA